MSTSQCLKVLIYFANAAGFYSLLNRVKKPRELTSSATVMEGLKRFEENFVSISCYCVRNPVRDSFVRQKAYKNIITLMLETRIVFRGENPELMVKG